MDIGALFLLLALLILIGLFVARPFMESLRAPAVEGQERSALLAERDRLLTALQEFDFDHTLGKIPAEDYPAQRAALLQRGAAILRQIDSLAPSGAPGGSAEDRIEAAVAASRADAAATTSIPTGAADEDIEDLIARRRAARADKSAGFCPKCGKPILQSDAFCPACGRALK